MKIAVATDGSQVSGHFGHCGGFTIAEVENGKVMNSKVVPNPGHRPGFLPEFLSDLGVSCVIAGGMGSGALDLFAAKGIHAVVGASGNVDEVIKRYVAGSLEVGQSACNHGEEHDCNHC